MTYLIPRRQFLKSAAATVAALASNPTLHAAPSAPSHIKLETFDYQGVCLLPSRWLDQIDGARAFYLNLSDDNILHGFRAAAGLPAPGKSLGGWAYPRTDGLLGDWTSAMSRLYRATGDTAYRDKATYLLAEWAKTIAPDGNGRAEYAKMNCGLVDMHLYAADPTAMPLLDRITAHAEKNISRERLPAIKQDNVYYSGRPGEWYKLSENLYRAYQITGDPRYRTFAEVWLYPTYWNKFAGTASPADAHGVHAFSHVNTFSSAAMHYEVTGDPVTLRILVNAFDYLQNTQCFATGGYGPNERFMAPDGSLGRSLDTRSDTFETGCGSWGAFKMAQHLIRFTGEARYGDWIEQLFYNGIGASLPVTEGGRNFYYSDYRVAGGMKVDRWDNFTCCSGTYFQDLAAYHDLIAFKNATGLNVNLYVPSEITWTLSGTQVKLTQHTTYPLSESITLNVDPATPTTFDLRLRVPQWSQSVSLKVNGKPSIVPCKPGTWATISRQWSPGDTVELHIPMPLRTESVDRQHPDRVAVVRGPVVLALDDDYHDPNFLLPPDDESLNRLLIADDTPLASHFSAPAVPGMYRVERPDGQHVRLRFRPFYAYNEGFPYRMYFDRKDPPYPLW
ncbi:beta-L-arabinofuranosidase domain-containing protein [Granulicella sibirica]|uniref:Putative glycosyl hydrolase (DUF1680) n=1 Tax=Granulicella sibirica TaxID=2479048 RepID=A0A4Q0SY08_9BACT|nr:beta-L-arabinofuranosidase domain-containing protein [Granulicella sibirica]RXH54359.1 putative glycosyl hydrolase (DUF1680) [Granulicella sibirica]